MTETLHSPQNVRYLLSGPLWKMFANSWIKTTTMLLHPMILCVRYSGRVWLNDYSALCNTDLDLSVALSWKVQEDFTHVW